MWVSVDLGIFEGPTINTPDTEGRLYWWHFSLMYLRLYCEVNKNLGIQNSWKVLSFNSGTSFLALKPVLSDIFTATSVFFSLRLTCVFFPWHYLYIFCVIYFIYISYKHVQLGFLKIWILNNYIYTKILKE